MDLLPAAPGQAETAADAAQDEPVDENEADWVEFNLFGRVLDRGSQRPIGDVAIRFLHGESTLAGTRSDEEGAFIATFRGPARCSRPSAAVRGWTAVLARPLTEEERSAAEETLLYLERGTSAVVSGLVTNAQTDEGVFSVQVELAMDGAGLSETIETDARGTFLSTIAFPAGPITARVIDPAPDGPVALGGFTREHLKDGLLGEAWKLAVDIGPSYLLDSTSGGSLGPDFAVTLTVGAPESEFAGLVEVRGNRMILVDEGGSALALTRLGYGGGSATNSGEEREPTTVSVRAGSGGPSWVRFPLPFPPLEDDQVAQLQVRGGNRWLATIEVDSVVGHWPNVLGVPLRACGTVAGRFLDTAQQPIEGARVVLFDRGDRSEIARYETQTLADGSYRLRDVHVGGYRFAIEPEIHSGITQDLTVEQGSNTLDPFFVPPTVVAGEVSGELLIEAGVPHQIPILTLESREGSSFRRMTAGHTVAKDDGQVVYGFRFPEVPSGAYDLFVGSLQGPGQMGGFWTPRRHVIYPPDTDVRFTCRADDQDHFALRFLPRDTRGDPIPNAWVAFGPEGWWTGEYDVRMDEGFGIPRGVPLQWAVGRAGFRTERGTENDLVIRDDATTVELTLQSGWSATLYLVQDAPYLGRARIRSGAGAMPQGKPVRGARVLADGDPAGTSDRRGRVDIDLRRTPSRLEIRAPGLTALRLERVHEWRTHANEATVYFVSHDVLHAQSRR